MNDQSIHTDDVNEIRDRPLSKLTYRILSFNLLVIIILAMGVSYLGTARKYIIEAQLENLETETALYATILNAAASIAGKKTPDLFEESDQARQQAVFHYFNGAVSGLNALKEQKIVIYDGRGRVFLETGDLPMRRFYEVKSNADSQWGEKLSSTIQGLLSVTFRLQPLPDIHDAAQILAREQPINYGDLKIAAWAGVDGGLILTAFSPIYEGDRIVGGFRVIRRDRAVEDNFAETREEIFRFIFLAMIMTIAHSLYLAGSIGHPLRILAVAAEKYRLNQGRAQVIPDLSARDDEIGELSHAMREMAQSLEARVNAIEQFAADVAHELKNPLTSLRSAIETLPRVKNSDDQAQLMRIAMHDIQRMDRLISDISLTSKLDAELARDVPSMIDIKELLKNIIEKYHSQKVPMITLSAPEGAVLVGGSNARLDQVFCNLIDNAVSFSPPGGAITVSIDRNADRVKITVDDEGPGLPENKLHQIFERFYSERPEQENFGMHSGLGLSIAQQIIMAMGGKIDAENIKDADGRIKGARFIVRLKSTYLRNNFNG
ncbi:MAG: sensor N-terminal transmembrane domain-containing protein [Alphaproteobacteria bacterium]|nr:sensor N-terminal transmembrane domain-containing protein [Alphaproteobacteria bacterium]